MRKNIFLSGVEVMLALALSISVFSGCNYNNPENTEASSSPASGDTASENTSSALNSTVTSESSSIQSQTDTNSAGSVASRNSSTSSASSSKPVSTKPSDNTSSQTDPIQDKTRYVQKQFYISTWRAVHFGAEETKYTKIIKANKEAGINLIENAVLSRADGLMAASICEKEGVDFLISNITADKGYTGMGENYHSIDDELVKFVVDEVKSYKHLIGYYLWDEVLPAQFSICKKNIALFNKYDPKRLALTLIFPSYGTLKWYEPVGPIEASNYYKYVTGYVNQVDPPILCFDYYAFDGANTSIVTSNLWKDMGIFRKESIRTGKPFWWYFQGYDMADGTVGHMTREKLAVQMFAGIAYGCKAVSYFQSLGTLTDEFGEKTSLYEGAKSLNKEVQNLGNLMFHKKSEEIYQFGIAEGNQTAYFLDDISKSKLISGAPDKTIVSVFGDGSKAKYIMVVNKDHKEKVSGNLVFKSQKKIEEFNKVTNQFSIQFEDAWSIYMNIKPGDCAVYRVS